MSEAARFVYAAFLRALKNTDAVKLPRKQRKQRSRKRKVIRS